MGGDILPPPRCWIAATVISTVGTVTPEPQAAARPPSPARGAREPWPSPPSMSSPCCRPLPASDDSDGDGVRKLPGRGIGDVTPDLPFLTRKAGLGEEDDLGGGDTAERFYDTALCPSPARPRHAPCTLPGLMLIFSKPSLSSCCEHQRGRAREERGHTSAAPAISPQPKEAAAAASRLASANPSHRPEQPHLEHSCTAGDQPPRLPRDPPVTRPRTLPSSMVAPSHHLTWYPFVTRPGILPSPMPIPSIICPGTLLSLIPVPAHHPSQYPPIAPRAFTP